MTRRLHRLLAQSQGTASIEFALIGPVFISLLLGIVVAGLLMLSRAAIQTAAAQTARCVALGSADCANPTAYATSLISGWGASGFLKSVTVSVNPDTDCDRPTGRYSSVTITGAENLGLGYVSQFAGVVLTASACFPAKP